MELQENFFDTSVGRIHYKTVDEEHLLKPNDLSIGIFIHGANKTHQNIEFWEPLHEEISKFCIPVYVDLFGHGLSETDRETSLDTDVLSIIEIIVELKIKYNKRIFISGRSYGGLVALTATNQIPEKVEGLILIAPACNSSTINLLNAWKRPVIAFWDSIDPTVNISNFSFLKSAIPHAKLFSIGSPPDHNMFKAEKVFPRPESVEPTHVPEIVFSKFFIETLEFFIQQINYDHNNSNVEKVIPGQSSSK